MPQAGSVQVALPIPNTVSLVSQVHHLQVAALALDAQLQFTELTSTNALTFTIGAF